MKNSIILIPFNAPLESVCDYAEQTVRLVSKKHTVIGVSLSDPLSLIRDFPAIIQGKFLIRHWGTRILRPVMIVPLQRFELIKKLNIVLNILILNIWLFFQKKPAILWFFEPRYLRLFLSWLRFDVSLYDSVDYFPAYKQWRQEHLFCLLHASAVTANSRTLEREYRLLRKDVTAVPLGFSHHQMPQLRLAGSKSKQSPFVFGYVGTVGDRLDFHFLETLFQQRPKDRFVFIGPSEFDEQLPWSKEKERLFQKMLSYPNVSWLSKMSRKKVWQKAKDFDAGLIPYDTKDLFNKYAFPMKTMEYFYAGLPVISTDIDELSFYPDFVYQPQQQGWKGINGFLRQSNQTSRRRQRAISLENTWQKKLKAVTDQLERRMRRANSQL